MNQLRHKAKFSTPRKKGAEDFSYESTLKRWKYVYMHFRTFTQDKCTFGEINVDLYNSFCEYLLTAPQGLHKNKKLHINSAVSYWPTFRASIHTAYRDRKTKENPNDFLERIETLQTDKEHLSQDEIIRLASTTCSAPGIEASLPVLLSYDIEKERHQDAHLGGDTVGRCDAYHHTNVEGKGYHA